LEALAPEFLERVPWSELSGKKVGCALEAEGGFRVFVPDTEAVFECGQ
jgi:hypothetical protein